MRARVIVFPVKGRNWCFTTSHQPSVSDSASTHSPSTFKELWVKISSTSQSNPKPFSTNAQLLIDFAANKMNRAWVGLENAPEGSLKKKIHGVGLRLLARVKPSEMFLKSISQEATYIDVLYPASLNVRLVRRRLRHIAMRGTVIHKKYFYGSVALLPLTSAFMVLPLPNVPFFWVLFRTYSHWHALQGSEKLFQLVSDGSQTIKDIEDVDSDFPVHNIKRRLTSPLVLHPSKELEELLDSGKEHDGLSKSAISDICHMFSLNTNDVLKYRNLM